LHCLESVTHSRTMVLFSNMPSLNPVLHDMLVMLLRTITHFGVTKKLMQKLQK
jgi:hypothetical protein